MKRKKGVVSPYIGMGAEQRSLEEYLVIPRCVYHGRIMTPIMIGRVRDTGMGSDS
jgi:hypothetical protein